MAILTKAKTKIEDKVMKTADAVTLKGQTDFIYNVMKWENVSFEEAQNICHGQTNPPMWEYTLGYKMSDAIWMMGMTVQRGKKARAKAVENFRKMLTPEELELFDKEVNADGKLKKQMDEAKRKNHIR